MNKKSHWGALLGAGAFALTLSGQAHATTEPDYQTPEQANAALDKYCSPENLKTFAGNRQCVQEVSGQSWKLAESFHASLFPAVGLAAEAGYYPDMVKRWALKISPKTPDQYRDILTVKDYHNPCYNVLSSNIHDPSSALKFSHTTAYGPAKYCIETAVKFSRQYNLPLDFSEAARLSQRIEKLYDYYKTHAIPQAPAEKEAEKELAPLLPPSPVQIPRRPERTYSI
ncbi:MAG: hypothetical protein PHX61_08730 [Alphaproteobacteria bacterium]|nr:hypothetical protein [Alphaproteobacteria bacterium]